LGVLALALVLRALWAALGGGATPPAGLTQAPRRAAPDAGSRFARGDRGREAAIPEEVVELELDRLAIRPRELTAGRDPFRFAPPPPPPPPPPPTREELERRRREEEERLRRAREEAELALVPRPPDLTLVYLGCFGPAAQRVAVFADQGREKLYNALTGDVLEGKFIVDRINFESVDIKFVGFPEAPAKRLAIGG
jgi:hypothetical protein